MDWIWLVGGFMTIVALAMIAFWIGKKYAQPPTRPQPQNPAPPPAPAPAPAPVPQTPRNWSWLTSWIWAPVFCFIGFLVIFTVLGTLWGWEFAKAVMLSRFAVACLIILLALSPAWKYGKRPVVILTALLVVAITAYGLNHHGVVTKANLPSLPSLPKFGSRTSASDAKPAKRLHPSLPQGTWRNSEGHYVIPVPPGKDGPTKEWIDINALAGGREVTVMMSVDVGSPVVRIYLNGDELRANAYLYPDSGGRRFPHIRSLRLESTDEESGLNFYLWLVPRR